MRNHLIRDWLAAYLSHNPRARPAQAWAFLTQTALPLGVIDGIAFDEQAGVLWHQPGHGRAPRVMNRSAFTRTMQRLRASGKA